MTKTSAKEELWAALREAGYDAFLAGEYADKAIQEFLESKEKERTVRVYKGSKAIKTFVLRRVS